MSTNCSSKQGIDLRQWYKWKQAGGLYFLSRAKENMKITCYGGIDFDREDPLNAGVLSDEQAATETAGVMFRYIRYRCPQSDTEYAFITNQMQIRPGGLAWLYMRRWDIEKTYDTFKNKLSEQKAWGCSSIAKTMQAQFLCLGHNLMVLLENIAQNEFGVQNNKEITRAQKRLEQIRETCEAKGQARSPLYENPRKRSQLTLKFIRWLRSDMLAAIALDAVPDRPDRLEPRVLKRRQKHYSKMTRPRHQKATT